MKECSVKRKLIFSMLAGMILSFCYTAGFPLDRYDSLDLSEGSFYVRLILGAVLAGVLMLLLWEGLQRLETVWKGRPDAGADGGRKRVLIEMAVLLLCWFPTLLSLFPGAFSYDALQEWRQVHEGMLTAHHPLIHELVLGLLVEAGHAFAGSYNAGIAAYTILQMVLFAWLLALSVQMMRRLGIRREICYFALAFFALSPVVQLFSVSATKDVIFSGTELLLLLWLLYFYCRREAFLASTSAQVYFAVTAFFTMILRNNGVYIVLGMLVVMAFSGLFREGKRRAVQLLLGILVTYLVYAGPVHAMLGVKAGGVEEMLSVPLQQMARVYHYDAEAFAEEDLELFLSIVPRTSLEKYRATVSDFVKHDFQTENYRAHRKEFWGLWVRLGTKHPMTYLNSFLINTVDFWYPHAVVDGYRHADGRSSYFDYQVDEPGSEVIVLPALHDYYERISLDPVVQSKPFAFLVFSPGWYLAVFAVLFFYLWCGRRYRLLLPQILLVIHFGTVLLGPVALVRYVLIFFLAFPLFVGIALDGRRMQDTGEQGVWKQNTLGQDTRE